MVLGINKLHSEWVLRTTYDLVCIVLAGLYRCLDLYYFYFNCTLQVMQYECNFFFIHIFLHILCDSIVKKA